MSKHMRQEGRVAIGENNPAIVRDEDLCVECRLCAGICNEYVGVNNAYDLAKTGGRSVCIHCGQCIPVCPTNSLQIKSSCDAVRKAVADPDKIVIFSTSPSVRVALGDAFGMADGTFVEGQRVELLRRLGGDYVLDTNFAADLTICEEAAELIERITKAKGPLPQFTSCCSAWVRYCETFHPEMIPHISSAKSPIGMQGPTVKTYFAKKMNLDPKRVVHVAVTPCTAKKAEILREEMNAAGRLLGDPAMRDTDYVITTVELADWAKAARINFAELPEGAFDRLMGEGSGAGVIFGNTGGVMEAALRTAYRHLTGEAAPGRALSPDPRPRPSGRQGGHRHDRRQRHQRRRHLRHRLRRRVHPPPQRERDEQALSLRRGDVLPRRLHLRRRPALRLRQQGRRASRGPHCEPLQAR